MCIPLSAQKVQIKAYYDYHFFDPRGIEKHHDFLLLANRDKSLFYNNHTQWLDSTRCTKDGEAWYTQTGMVLVGQVMGKPREEVEMVSQYSGCVGSHRLMARCGMEFCHLGTLYGIFPHS